MLFIRTDQRPPNIFAQGRHKLLHKSSRIAHELTVQNKKMLKHEYC